MGFWSRVESFVRGVKWDCVTMRFEVSVLGLWHFVDSDVLVSWNCHSCYDVVVSFVKSGKEIKFLILILILDLDFIKKKCLIQVIMIEFGTK